jgi:hypothetical protein
MNSSKSLALYRTARPLIGGLAAPEEADEINLQVSMIHQEIV